LPEGLALIYRPPAHHKILDLEWILAGITRFVGAFFNAQTLRRVILSQEEIQPGGRRIQLPIAGRDRYRFQSTFLPIAFQPHIGPFVDTLAPAGIYFTPTLVTSSAGTSSLVLWTLGHGAEKSRVDQGAIATITTIIQQSFQKIFQFVQDGFQPGALHHWARRRITAKPFVPGSKNRLWQNREKTYNPFPEKPA